MNEESDSHFCSLNDECINNIFDWLSIGDLCRLKVTCKRLYLLANEHYQRTYFAFHLKPFGNVLKNIDNTKYHKSFASENIQIKNDLTINTRTICDPSLKQFHHKAGEISRSYGTKLVDFFKLHPNIKEFSSHESVDTTNWLLNSGTKFNDLVLRIGASQTHHHMRVEVVLNLDKIFDNIHCLYRRQQIKTLHLKIHNKDFLLSPKFHTLKCLEGIESEVVGNTDKIVNAFISLPNLKMLIFYKNMGLYQHHYETLAQKLHKLEEFHTDAFYFIDEIIPFVRYSPNLKCI